MTHSAADLAAGAVVTVVFLSIVAAAEAWCRLGNPHPESTRKLIHITGGLVALFLPLVIHSHLVVLAMALGMGALFLAGKLTGKLQSLHGVSRKSSGTEYFPLIIYLLFYFTQGEPWKYFICVLVLTSAAALAALVGIRYGRMRYEVDQNYKSVEGSLVFLVVTVLGIVVPLLAWPMPNPPSPATCLLTALLVAMLTTGFEALAQHGRDNLWVPLGTLVLLNRTLPLPECEIALRVVVLLVICATTGFAAWRTATFNVGGTLVLILAAYACWTLTSIDWGLPVFFSFAFYVSVMVTRPRHISIASTPVLKTLSLPFLVMVGAYLSQHFGATSEYRFLFGPFLAGCVTVTAQSALDQTMCDRGMGSRTKLIGSLGMTMLSCVVVVLPSFLVQSEVSAEAPLWVAAGTLAVGIPFGVVFDRPGLADSNHRWWLARSLFIAAAMSLVALLQVTGLSPPWHPR